MRENEGVANIVVILGIDLFLLFVEEGLSL